MLRSLSLSPASTTPDPVSETVEADWLDFAGTLCPATVDLLYADPPFFTGTTQRTSPTAVRKGRTIDAQYADCWESMPLYIEWLRQRLVATIPALKPSGVILLHCDWHASHHIRVMLDEILSPGAFINHLIWSYGLGGSSPRRFARKHDDIFAYAIDPALYYFNPPMVPATSVRLKGKLKKATDVIDIPSLNNMADERTGYPTQKPLELLELLIGAFCPPGGMVIDPCFGSGTTLVAAARTQRLFRGSDASPDAVQTCRLRLDNLRSPRGDSEPLSD